MGLIKDFKDAIAEYTPGDKKDAPVLSDATPAQIGDIGSIQEFRDVLTVKSKDLKEKLATYTPLQGKTTDKANDAYNAYTEAFDNLENIKKQFVSGAIEGFNYGRTDNIQAIFADLENFCQADDASAQTFAINTLAELLVHGFDPEKVPALALAKATAHNKQLILNGALIKLSAADPQNEKTAAAITALKNANAGAPVPGDDGKIMIRSKKAPKKLVLAPVHRFGK